MSKFTQVLAGLALALRGAQAAAGTSILFIGNSFTFCAGSAVRFYRNDTVTDLNDEGVGGVPALFKSFADQAGLDYDVALETRGGTGLDFHLEHKAVVIGTRPWDVVVMHGYSTLDADQPGDPRKLAATSTAMAEFLRGRNPDVSIYLTATWSRADQVYPADGAWAGTPIETMARDVRTAYDAAAQAARVKAVSPVGEAWNLAFERAVADRNPYDGVDAGKIDLWTDNRPCARGRTAAPRPRRGPHFRRRQTRQCPRPAARAGGSACPGPADKRRSAGGDAPPRCISG